jgi:GT2 family glycosyltransferase/glycosyltransferase involved in cell wall biosynthesis
MAWGSDEAIGTKLLIAVPFYKNEELVAPLVQSLIDCAADLAAIGAEVVLFNDSPGYAPLQEALEAILPRAQATFACRLVRNEVNLGFVQTMNGAIAEAVSRRLDLLLLNSDTVVFRGAFPEMLRIAALDPMIAFVNPRSDNATLATLPIAHRATDSEVVFDAAPYAALAARLPELSYVPTAIGFCMLIRWHILAEFGGLDPIFGAGYNEENDLVMRAGRCGYRAVLANRAFVRHLGEASFSITEISKTVLEPVNRAILDARYPEYGAVTSAHFVSPETRAEWLLGTLNPDAAGRLDLAFDFSSFGPRANGTFKAGRQLLKSAVEDWHDHFNVFVLCSQEAYEFHGYAELGVSRCDPDGPELFAVIFREGQPYDWEAIQRMVLKGAVIGSHMLDTISLDCTQLTSPELFNIWQFVFRHSDFFVAPSDQSMRQIALRFQIPASATSMFSHLSLDLDDYRHGAYRTGAVMPQPGGGVLLVIGNHFPHKYLVPTANALAGAFPERKVVALGQAKPGIEAAFNPYALPALSDAVNLAGISVGHLTDDQIGAFYAQADVVIFPSHYEGFGIPLLEALAANRPVFARPLPVFKELWESHQRNPNIHFYETTDDLVRRLRALPRWQVPPVVPQDQGGARSAREIRALLDAALLKADYRVIAERLRALQLDKASADTPGLIPMSPAETAARLFGERAEWFARWVFRAQWRYLFCHMVFEVVLRPTFRFVRKCRRALGSAG